MVFRMNRVFFIEVKVNKNKMPAKRKWMAVALKAFGCLFKVFWKCQHTDTDKEKLLKVDIPLLLRYRNLFHLVRF